MPRKDMQLSTGVAKPAVFHGGGMLEYIAIMQARLLRCLVPENDLGSTEPYRMCSLQHQQLSTTSALNIRTVEVHSYH